MNDTSSDVILICTTEEGLNSIITLLLKPEGVNLISALNQHMLFSLIELYRPLAVIADSGLSVIMGRTPFELIKRIDRFSDTKIILITTDASQGSKDAYEHVDEVVGMDSISSNLLSVVCNYISCGRDVPVNEAAGRLARAIVSDIVHYNSEAAYRGAADGTFYEILSKEIERGREVYKQRVSVNMQPMPDYFDDAIRDFINKAQQCNLVLP